MGSAKMSIGKKLGLSFLVLILMIAITNGTTLLRLLVVQEQWQEATEIKEMQTSLAQREIEHLQWVSKLQEYLISGTTQGITVQLDPRLCNLGKWMASEDFAHLIEHYPAFEQQFARIYEPHNQLHASARAIEERLRNGDPSGAQDLYHERTVPSLNQTVGVLQGVRSELETEVTRIGLEVDQQISSIVLYSNIILAVAVVLGFLIAWLVTKAITKPLGVLTDVAQKIGSGDLGVRWTIESQDEVGDLSASLEQMMEGLRKLVRGIRSSSEGVNALSQNLSSMAVETGAAITEVASTSNEFASASVNMAENADSMRLGSDHAVQELERGLDMLRVAVKDVASARGDVQNLTQAVNSLAEQSKEIGAIVDLITQISDQTNLLALNAAIEAARAGDSGRGFAVVADEVRRLAERSREASGDIGELIQQILRGTEETMGRMEKADSSVERVDAQIDLTGNTFVAITKVFRGVASQVTEMARAAEDVGAGSEEIAASTEEQSAIANAIADDAEKLADLAVGLQGQISNFRGFS